MTPKLDPKLRSGLLLENIDTSDCGVIAIQSLTGLDRDAAEDLARRHGYQQPPFRGMPRTGVLAAIEEGSGGTLVELPVPYNGTPASFAMNNEVGEFAVFVSGHAMTVKNGDLYNARGSFATPLQQVFRLERS